MALRPRAVVSAWLCVAFGAQLTVPAIGAAVEPESPQFGAMHVAQRDAWIGPSGPGRVFAPTLHAGMYATRPAQRILKDRATFAPAPPPNSSSAEAVDMALRNTPSAEVFPIRATRTEASKSAASNSQNDRASAALGTRPIVRAQQATSRKSSRTLSPEVRAVYVSLPAAARTLPFNASSSSFGSPIILGPVPSPASPPPLSVTQAVSVDGKQMYWAVPPTAANGSYSLTAYAISNGAATAGATLQFANSFLIYPGSNGASAYVWQSTSSSTMALTVYSADLTTILGAGPTSSSVIAGQVADPTSGNAYLVDTAGTFRVLMPSGSGYSFASGSIANASTPTANPGTLSALAVTLDGSRVYTFSGSTINIIDPHALSIVGSVSVPYPAVWVGVNPSGTRLYVGQQTSNQAVYSFYVSIIDTATKQVLTTVEPFTGSYDLLGGVALTPDGAHVLVGFTHAQEPSPPYQSAFVYTLDATTGSTTATASPPAVPNPPEYPQVGLILVPAGTAPPAPPPERACGRCNGTTIGHPIDVATGELWNEKTDISLSGPSGLSFTRFYGNQSTGSVDLGGTNWSHNYAASLDTSSLQTGKITYYDFEGMPYYFHGITPGATGAYDNLTGMKLALSSDSSTFTLTRFDSTQMVFDGSGSLKALRDRVGNIQTVNRDTAHANRISSVADSLGRSLCFYYDSSNRISSVAAWMNTAACPASVPASSTTTPVVSLTYDSGPNCAQGDLCTVTEPDGKAWTYQYTTADSNFPTNLSKVQDPLGNPEETNVFSGNRIVHQETGACAGSSPCADTGGYVNIAYPASGSTVTIIDGLGRSSTIAFDPTTLLLTQMSGPVCKCGGDQTRSYAYDSSQRVVTQSDDAIDGSVKHTTTYGYGRDASGQTYPGPTTISEVLDSAGTTRTTTVAYYPLGDSRQDLPQTVNEPSIDQPGSTMSTVYAYTSSGLLTSIARTGYVRGLQTTYTTAWTYDARGRVLSQKQPRTDVNTATTYTYFSDTDSSAARAGQLQTVADPLGHATQYAGVAGYNSYTPFGDSQSSVDPNGVTSEYTFDARGRLVSTSLLPASEGDQSLLTQWVYDAAGRLTQHILPAKNGVALGYDSSDRLAQIVRFDASMKQYERMTFGYNSADQPTASSAQKCSSPSPSCASWSPGWNIGYAYSPTTSNLSRITNADNTYESVTYTAAGALAAFNDENHTTGTNYAYLYDVAGRRLKATRALAGAPGGAVSSSYAYDLHDNITSATDPNGNVTAYQYDDFDRVVKETSPVRGMTTYAYDPDNNLTSTTNANGTMTVYTYDALDRVLSENDTKGSVNASEAWTYDDPASGHFGIGRLSTMTDPSGSTAYTYDRLGNVQVENHNVAGSIFTYGYFYDVNNNQSEVTYPDGTIVSFAYDFADRPFSAQQTLPSSTLSRRRSVASLRAISLSAPAHQAKPESAHPRMSAAPIITLSPAGRVNAPAGRVNPLSNTRSANGPARATGNAGVTARPDSVLVSAATYAPFGPMTSMAFGNGTTQSMSYNQRYLLQENKLTASGRTIADHVYSEDAAGNVTAISDALDSGYARSFGYDDLNRLTTANAGSKLWGTASGNGYTYDSMGNMLTTRLGSSRTDTFAYRSNGANSLPLISSVIENGNTRNVTYDAIGSEITDGNNTFNYGARELVGFSLPNVQAYAYDGLRRRVQAQTASGQQRTYFYDSTDHLLAESALGSPGSMTIAYDYVWFGGRPVAQLDSAGTRWTYTDHLGTPLLQSDSSAAVNWQAEHEPFGEVSSLRAADIHQPLRLPGQESEQFDTGANGDGSGLSYNGTRWYQAAWGRYSQADRVGLLGGPNMFSYVDDRPTSLQDRLGLASCLYMISNHYLMCVSDKDPDQVQSVGPDGVFSGATRGTNDASFLPPRVTIDDDGSCMNNADCARTANRGPIPPGNYKINTGIRPLFFSLESVPPVRWWQVWRRNGFEIHPGTISIGCVTIKKSHHQAYRNYVDVARLLQAEMGRNRLSVIP